MKLSLIQTSLAWGDVEENLRHFSKKIAVCKDTDVILLPEMFTNGGMLMRGKPGDYKRERDMVAERFEEVRGKMKIWAGESNAVVIGSTVYNDHERYYNRLLAVFPDGNVKYYDKRHCFRMGGENEYFSAGNRQLVFDFRGIRIVAFICYDLRFPVWCRNVGEYDLAVFIANWPASRNEVWKTLLKARAIENQAYVAGVNCIGTDRNGFRYSGNSMVLNAKGETIADSEPEQDTVIDADIDREELQAFREKFPVLQDGDRFVISDV